MVEAQQPQASASTAKKCMDQPFALIAEQSGSYFPDLVACHDSMTCYMFSSQRQVSSRIITVFVVVIQYKQRVFGLSSKVAIAGAIICVNQPKRMQSGALYSNLQLVLLEAFGCLAQIFCIKIWFQNHGTMLRNLLLKTRRK